MSAISSLSSAVPASAYSDEPTAISKGGPAAQQAYSEGLGFENMLLSQLTQQMTQTIDGADPSDGSDSSTDPSDGSGDASAGGAYSSLETSALSQGIMSGDNNAIALQVAQSIDPKLIGKTL